MKKLLIILPIIMICFFLIKSYLNINSNFSFDLSKNHEWQTYTKKNNLIKSHKSTIKELKNIRVYNKLKQTNQRSIASIQNKKELAKIYSDNPNDKLINPKQFNFANKINPKWKSLLAHNLLRFQDSNTKVFIKNIESIILIKNGKAKHAQKIIITYLLDNGIINSANALIDKENAKIIKVWNKTVHEKFGHLKNNLRPSGAL